MEQFKHIDKMEVEQQKHVKQPLEHTIYRRIQNMTVKFAETPVGQFVIAQGDRALRSIEATAKWSLPKENRVAHLQRPLPWLPFLALVLTLRVLRFWLSCAALAIGNDPVTAFDMIYFIQTRRRKLRAIRLQGLKVIKERKATTSNGSLMRKLSKTLLTAVCCTGQHKESDHNVLLLRQHWCKPNAESSVEKQPPSKKRTNSYVSECEDEQEEQHLSFAQMIEKYANQASDDDSDYMPPNDDEHDDNTDDDNATTNTESSADSTVEDELKHKDSHTTAVIDLQKEPNSKQNLNMPLPMLIKREPNTDAAITNSMNGNDKNENGRKANVEEFIDEERKSTPGHMSAAITKIKNPVIHLNNTAAVDIVAAVVEQEHALNTSAVTLSPEATGSFIEFETPEMASASSSEDIFYSPIGSPTELTQFMQPITIINNNKTTNKNQDVKPENNENIEPKNTSVNTQNVIPLEAPAQPQPQPQAQQQQKHHPHHYHHQQHHHNVHRYRGKNRRKFDALP